MIRHICLFLSLCLFFACGSTTKVILLPDQDGKTGKAVVKNQTHQTVLEKPYTLARVGDDTNKVTQEALGKKEVEDKYHTLLAAEPLKPVSFLLYFQNDSTRLTPESMKLIPKVLETAKQREPSIISIIGHADTKGKTEYNSALALDRAKRVGKLLNDSGITLEDMVVKSHGENDPLIKTGDNESEARNRRVEIMIR